MNPFTNRQPGQEMITANQIKTALIWYCRFKRQWVCAPEVEFNFGWADILVDTGTAICEIEVKVNKGDLWNGEAKKSKHFRSQHANKFYICVPETLKDEALKWVDSVNPKYGIMIFDQWKSIVVVKTARELTGEYNPELQKKIIRRLSSMVYFYMNRDQAKPQTEQEG